MLRPERKPLITLEQRFPELLTLEVGQGFNVRDWQRQIGDFLAIDEFGRRRGWEINHRVYKRSVRFWRVK